MSVADRLKDLDGAALARLTQLLAARGDIQVPMALTAHVEAGALAGDKIQQEMRRFVPDYMVPDRINVVPALPRLPNGKLDRAGLENMPTPEKTAVAQDALNSETLEKIRTIWAEVLGMDMIHDDDNFFELGGDSLLSISVVSKARAQGLSLIPSDLFDYATLGALAARVGQLDQDTTQQVEDGPLIAPASTQHGQMMFVLNANRRMLDLLNEQLDAPRDLNLITLHWDNAALDTNAQVETIAREFVETIKRTQPEGPYALGGFSMGAVMAHEAAKQLSEVGQTVGELVLIDPPENPNLFKATRNPDQVFEPLEDTKLSLRNKCNAAVVLALGKICRALGIAIPTAIRSAYVRATYLRAAAKYSIPDIPVDPIVVRRERRAKTTIWAPAFRVRELREISCSHHDFHRTDDVIRTWTGLLADVLKPK